MNLKTKKQAKIDLLIVLLGSIIPAIIYLFFAESWRGLNQSQNINFWIKFSISTILAYCLAGLGFTIAMLFRKEKFSEFGLIKKNAFIAILFSIICFLPHFIFLIVTRGFHGYIPMSGAIVYDSVMQRSIQEKIFCMIIIFIVWGFCEGFSYIYIAQKINVIFPVKSKWLNVGAIVGALLCVFMHGGISLDVKVMFDALTMFVFVYGILVTKNITGNAWGCIFSFFFLWNSFPSN